MACTIPNKYKFPRRMRIHIDKSMVDLDDVGELERWLEDAVREAVQASQKLAAEKMQPFMGALGDLGF